MQHELTDAKTQLADYTESYEQMRSSIDKLTASRNAYKQKAKSSAKDIQKLLHRVEGSVSASQLGLILAEKEALLKANEQLKTSLAQSELSRIDGSRVAALGGKKSKKKGVSLASLQLQNRDL